MTTEGYLRMRSGVYRGRQLVLVPDYLVPRNTFNARTYQSSYYFLFSPSTSPKISEIRHQFLHFLLDPFAARYPLPVEQRKALTEIMRAGSEHAESAVQGVQEMVTESLIKAVEMRLDRLEREEAEASLNEAVRSGALLCPPIFSLPCNGSRRNSKDFNSTTERYSRESTSPRCGQPGKRLSVRLPRRRRRPERLTEVERLIRQAGSQPGKRRVGAGRRAVQPGVGSARLP